MTINNGSEGICALGLPYLLSPPKPDTVEPFRHFITAAPTSLCVRLSLLLVVGCLENGGSLVPLYQAYQLNADFFTRWSYAYVVIYAI